MGNQHSKRPSPKTSSRTLTTESTVAVSPLGSNKNNSPHDYTIDASSQDTKAKALDNDLNGDGLGHDNSIKQESSLLNRSSQENTRGGANPSPTSLLTNSRTATSVSVDGSPVKVDSSVASGTILSSHSQDSSEQRLKSSLISCDMIQPPPQAHTIDSAHYYHHNLHASQQQQPLQQSQQPSPGQTTTGANPVPSGALQGVNHGIGQTLPEDPAAVILVAKESNAKMMREHYDHIKNNIFGGASSSPDNSNDDMHGTHVNGHDDQQQAHPQEKGRGDNSSKDTLTEQSFEDTHNQRQDDPSPPPPLEPSIPFAVLEPGEPILVKRPGLTPLTIPPSGTITSRSPPPLSPKSNTQNRSLELSPTARLPFLGSALDKSSKGMDLDDIISRLLDAGYSGKVSKNICLRNNEIVYICQTAREVFLSQPTLIELNAPVKIVGDIHGQYTDLLRMFEMCGFPPSANFLFLGDYVDRGKQSLETILLLFCYKIKYPENFFLLRGNHECANVTKVYGFYDECKRRASVKMWKAFVDVFNCLPLAGIVANKIFCVHGGLSPSLGTMDDIRALRRPTDVPDYGLLNDLLWSDPSDTALDWEDNERGVSYCFGRSIIQKFLNKHDFDLVCRAHMVVEDGYEFFNDRTLVTVFSAPNYCGEFDNFGAVMSVSEELLCSFELLKPIDQATAKAQMQSLAATNGGWRVNKQRLR
ncbi:hypothetical protein BGX28_006462 [Mortierella sp. GBA30]|nr:hypothetical protein BGX28_006462 [Mortierella sp. GBA30]